MEHLDCHTKPFAKTNVMWALARHGGSLRIASLLESSGLSHDELCDTLNELAESYWLKVIWRRHSRGDLPERLRRVDRITTTRLGRYRAIREPRRSKPARRQNVDFSLR